MADVGGYLVRKIGEHVDHVTIVAVAPMISEEAEVPATRPVSPGPVGDS